MKHPQQRLKALATETIAAGKRLIVDEHEEGMVTVERGFGIITLVASVFWSIIVSSVLIEASFALSDWWLTYSVGEGLHIYGLLAICNAVANVLRVTLFAFGTVVPHKIP